MTTPDWTLGILLGGASSRMGADKALLALSGTTLLEHTWKHCCADAVTTILSTGRPDRRLPDGVSDLVTVPDRIPGAGPLAGIEALAGAATTPVLVIVPCDMPGLRSLHLQALVAALEDGDCCVYGDSGSKRVMPLAVRTDWAAAVLPQLIDEGDLRMLALLGAGDCRILTEDSLTQPQHVFCNVNTRNDFEEFLKQRD